MGTADNQANEATLWRGRRGRPRLECRECEIICERVVDPWQCLASGCECVYSYEDGDTMYFGCLHKVFAPELDLAPFCKTEGNIAVSARTTGLLKRTDPYGPIRVTRPPREHCRIRIEQAYDAVAMTRICCNPTFFHQTAGHPEDEMKLTATPPDRRRGRGHRDGRSRSK